MKKQVKSRITYGHGLAPVQTVDGRLGFGVSTEFNEGATCWVKSKKNTSLRDR